MAQELNDGNDLKHIRHCLLFLFDEGLIAKQARERVCAIYDNGAISYRTAKEWFSRFRAGDRSVEDLSRSGRPVEFDEDALKQAVEEDGKVTIRELAQHFNFSFGTIQRHLRKMGKVNF